MCPVPSWLEGFLASLWALVHGRHVRVRQEDEGGAFSPSHILAKYKDKQYQEKIDRTIAIQKRQRVAHQNLLKHLKEEVNALRLPINISVYDRRGLGYHEEDTEVAWERFQDIAIDWNQTGSNPNVAFICKRTDKGTCAEFKMKISDSPDKTW